MLSTIICLRSLRLSRCWLRLLLAYTRMHPPEAAIAARLSPPLEQRRHSTCSSVSACHPHACCVCPSPARSCAKRQLSATPVGGPLSSKPAVPTLQLLLRFITPTQTMPVCLRLWCLTSSTSAMSLHACRSLRAPHLSVYCIDAAESPYNKSEQDVAENLLNKQTSMRAAQPQLAIAILHCMPHFM